MERYIGEAEERGDRGRRRDGERRGVRRGERGEGERRRERGREGEEMGDK